MIKVSHAIDVIMSQLFLFCFAILVGMEECSNNTKNGKLLVFLAVVVRSLKILGRLWKWRAINQHVKYFDIIRTQFGKK